MCLILFSWLQDADRPLVLAANRDEFYQRPTAAAHWWEDDPDIFAGRDLQGGGTWMGVNRKGYWAALTNYREVPGQMPAAPSRGPLVADYLRESADPEAYLAAIKPRAQAYNGFNLLLGTPQAIWYFSNRDMSPPHRLKPGLYGLSNHVLDTAWPKVQKGKRELSHYLSEKVADPDKIFSLLGDSAPAPDEELPQTGVGLEWERLLSPLFIESPTYGTRVSTVLERDKNGTVWFEERGWVPSKEIRKITIKLK